MLAFSAGLVLGLVLGFLAAILLRRKSAPAPSAAPPTADTFRSLLNAAPTPSPPPGPPPETAAESEDQLVARLRQNLRIKFLYQEDKIDHAIEVERERNPNAPHPELMQAAIDRWERENR